MMLHGQESDFNESKHKHKDVEASRLAVSSSSYFSCIIDTHTHTKIMNFNYQAVHFSVKFNDRTTKFIIPQGNPLEKTSFR